MNAEAQLRFKGINQQDLAARNVILQIHPSPQAQEEAQPNTISRVVLIDYNTSVIYAKAIYKIGPYDGTTLPPNPTQTHWRESLQEFHGWIPAAWETNPRLRQEWLKKYFGGDNLARYGPIKQKLEFGGC